MANDSIFDLVNQQLASGGLEAIGRQVGVSSDDVAKVASGALPALLGGLSRNAAQPAGAESLLGALDRDHDGSILDDVAGFLGSSGAGDGASILGHVFGGSQGNVAKGLSESTGVQTGQVQQILAMLAPLVLGALGKQRQSGGFDLSDLGSILAGESQRAAKGAPGGLADVLGGLLDRDGDGSALDDVAELGSGLLGGLLGGKR